MPCHAYAQRLEDVLSLVVERFPLDIRAALAMRVLDTSMRSFLDDDPKALSVWRPLLGVVNAQAELLLCEIVTPLGLQSIA